MIFYEDLKKTERCDLDDFLEFEKDADSDEENHL